MVRGFRSKGVLFLFAATVGVLLGAQPGQQGPLFPKAEQEEFFKQSFAALGQGKAKEAVRLATAGIRADATNYFAYIKRAQIHDMILQRSSAVRDFTTALQLNPRAGEAYHLRGCAQFKLGRVKEAINDWLTYVRRFEPKAEVHHWQLGIAYALDGRFAAGRKQFNWHWTVNHKDAEVALWQFLCVAKLEGLERARAELITVEPDKRVPMAELHELYAGRLRPSGVMKAVAAASPDAAELAKRQFFANWYIGLFYEAAGKLPEALMHVDRASRIALGNAHLGFRGDSPNGQLRGGDIVLVHRDRLKVALEHERAAAWATDPARVAELRMLRVSIVMGFLILVYVGGRLTWARRRIRGETGEKAATSRAPRKAEEVAV